ncbi:unnamed protein product, partial [Strongylus vulgaris]
MPSHSERASAGGSNSNGSAPPLKMKSATDSEKILDYWTNPEGKKSTEEKKDSDDLHTAIDDEKVENKVVLSIVEEPPLLANFEDERQKKGKIEGAKKAVALPLDLTPKAGAHSGENASLRSPECLNRQAQPIAAR